MVAFLGVILITSALGLGLLFFTPIGDKVFEAIDYSPSEPSNTQTQTTQKETDPLNLEGTVDEGFDYLDDFAKTKTLEMTDDEKLTDVATSTANVGRQGFNLYFALKDLIADSISYLSPIQLGSAMIGIIATFAGFLFIFGMGKNIIKHVGLFLIILVGIIIFFLVVGNGFQI